MTTYTFPTSSELRAIEQVKLPRLIADRPIFKIFPVRDVDDSVVTWEQFDNFIGLQQVRGYNGAPAQVKAIGLKRYTEAPGTYGEFALIDEFELTRRRQIGTPNSPIDINDLVMQKQDQLLERRLDRIEYIGWQLAVTGTFSVAGPDNAVLHTGSYTTQAFSASTVWSTAATSTPLADFRAVQLKSRGFSVNFGRQATAYMNRTTANNLLNNTNSADLFGRRTAGLGTFNSLDQVNQLLAGDDLPAIQVYDEGYYDDTSTFQLYIPNGKVVVAGARTSGVAIGEYQMTRNANNPGLAPGSYTKVFNRGENRVPASIEIHDGHNGGPALMFPSALVVMSV